MNHQFERYLLGKGKVVTLSFLLVLLFCLTSSIKLFSQDIISRDISDYPGGSVSSPCSTSPYTGCIVTLPPAKYGESYSFTIPIKPGVLRSDINFVFNQHTSCSDGSISFSPNGRIEMDVASICHPLTGNLVEIDLKAKSSDVTDSIKYYLPILRGPVKVVLVLDISGSMSLPVPGGTEVRWQVLKNAVELFTHKLEEFKLDRDLIGVTYFSTELTQPAAPIGEGFIPIDTVSPSSSTVIKTDMLGKGPTNLTAMGKGLLNAKLKLDGNNPINARKLVLLFTDGLQNVNPLVNPDGITLSPGSFTLNDVCNGADSIRYYTIGMGNITLIPEVLAQIAQANKGVSLTTTTGADEGDINTFFQYQFANMLQGSSPQVVSQKTGKLSSTGTTYTYPINANVTKLYFELINPDATNVTLKLEKDGKDLTRYAKIVKGTFYKTLSLTLPLLSPEAIITQGDWNLTISGSSSKKYSLTCFVDDHFIDVNCKSTNTVYTVGDPIDFQVQLSFAGKPIKGDGNKVQVMLLKPGDDLGDLLTKYTDNKTDSLNDVEAGAETKYLHLIQSDESFYKALLPQSQIIDLEDSGNGIFKGRYTKTDLTGVYQIIYLVNGEVTGFGKFERQKQYSVVFKFGQISESSTDINAHVSTPPASTTHENSGSIATIKIKPKNNYGHYLGPGYASKMSLTVDSKQGTLKSIKDNLDGTYTFTIVNVPANVKPSVKIVVMGEILYEGGFPSPKIHFWQYLVLIFLFLMLLLRYVNAHTGKTWLIALVWVMIILWVAFMILQKLGIIHF